MNKKKIVIFFTLLSIVFAGSVSSLMLKLSLSELVSNADVIITGEVVEKECRWGERVKCIYTYVTVLVDEYVKGEGEKEIILMHPGGEVGRKGMMISNMPSFQEGEEVLIFARKLKDRLAVLNNQSDTGKIYGVYGFAQGKCRIFVDETGEKMVRNNFSNLCIQDADGMKIVDEKVLASKPLSGFISEIREVMKECE